MNSRTDLARVPFIRRFFCVRDMVTLPSNAMELWMEPAIGTTIESPVGGQPTGVKKADPTRAEFELRSEWRNAAVGDRHNSQSGSSSGTRLTCNELIR